MDNDVKLDRSDDFLDDQSYASNSSTEEAKGIGLGWRVGVAIVALVVIAILAYPWFRNQLLSPPDEPNVTAVEPQANLSPPQATAQANPDSADAQFELGNSYVRAGQLDQALEAYRRVVELNPDYQAAYANMGVVYYQLQQLDLAAMQYKKALELDPDDAEVAYNLGALYLQQALSNGNQPDSELLDQAIIQLKAAMEQNPDLAEPHFSLGVAYNALNQPEEAIRAFETFLDLDSGQDPRARQEAERYLEILRGQNNQ